MKCPLPSEDYGVMENFACGHLPWLQSQCSHWAAVHLSTTILCTVPNVTSTLFYIIISGTLPKTLLTLKRRWFARSLPQSTPPFVEEIASGKTPEIARPTSHMRWYPLRTMPSSSLRNLWCGRTGGHRVLLPDFTTSFWDRFRFPLGEVQPFWACSLRCRPWTREPPPPKTSAALMFGDSRNGRESRRRRRKSPFPHYSHGRQDMSSQMLRGPPAMFDRLFAC